MTIEHTICRIGHIAYNTLALLVPISIACCILITFDYLTWVIFSDTLPYLTDPTTYILLIPCIILNPIILVAVFEICKLQSPLFKTDCIATILNIVEAGLIHLIVGMGIVWCIIVVYCFHRFCYIAGGSFHPLVIGIIVVTVDLILAKLVVSLIVNLCEYRQTQQKELKDE